MAGLVKPDDAVGADRLRFVTEAEASAYFTLHYSTQQANDWLLVSTTFIQISFSSTLNADFSRSVRLACNSLC